VGKGVGSRMVKNGPLIEYDIILKLASTVCQTVIFHFFNFIFWRVYIFLRVKKTSETDENTKNDVMTFRRYDANAFADVVK